MGIPSVGPLDVLRTAEHLRRPRRQTHQLAQFTPPEPRTPVPVHDPDQPPVAVELVPGAVDLAAHEAVGAAVDGGHHEPVLPAGDRVDPEEHAAAAHGQQRLDEHGHRFAPGQGLRAGRHLFTGRHDQTDGATEALPPADADDGLEPAGHRRAGEVLDGRAAAHDQRHRIVLGEPAPGVEHGVGERGPGREVLRCPGGDDEAGHHR
jgi:hypothetical protein